MTKKLLTFAVALFSTAMIFAEADYLCLTAESAMSAVSMKSELSDWTLPEVQYSFDQQTWYDFKIDHDTIDLIQKGDKVYFRGNSGKFSFGTTRYVQFTMRGSIAASGNVMSLIDPTCHSVWMPTRCTFVNLFANCISLNQAPQLPATSLTEYCYMNMFKGCTNLVEAPELPARELKEYCYAGMFDGCSKLNSMNVNFERWRPANATLNWVKDVAPTGVFTCPNTLDDTKIGWSNIPFGWNTDTFLGTPGLSVYIEANGKQIEVPMDSIQYINFEKSNIEHQGEDIYQLDMLLNDGTVHRIFVTDIDSMAILGYVVEDNNNEYDNKNGRMYVNGDVYTLDSESTKDKPSIEVGKTTITVDGEIYSFRNKDVEISFTSNRLFSHFEVQVCEIEYTNDPFVWEEAENYTFYAEGEYTYTFQSSDGRDSVVTCFVSTRESAPVMDLFTDVVAIGITEREYESYQWYRNGEMIEGANLQYYQEIGGLNGEYYVVVDAGTEYEMMSCPGYYYYATEEKAGIQKRISNGKFIIETTDGEIYDAQGQRL